MMKCFALLIIYYFLISTAVIGQPTLDTNQGAIIDFRLKQNASLYINCPTSQTSLSELNIDKAQKDTTIHLKIDLKEPFFIYNQNQKITAYLIFPNLHYQCNIDVGQIDLHLTCVEDKTKEMEANICPQYFDAQFNVFNEVANLGKINEYTHSVDDIYLHSYQVNLNILDSLLKLNVITQDAWDILRNYLQYNLINRRLLPFYGGWFDNEHPNLPNWYVDTLTQYKNSFNGASFLQLKDYRRALIFYNTFQCNNFIGGTNLPNLFHNVSQLTDNQDAKDFLYASIFSNTNYQKYKDFNKYLDSFNLCCKNKQYKQQILEQINYINKIENTKIQGSIMDLDGHFINLVELVKKQNKLVYIDCWASWCAPCLTELEKLKAQYPTINPDSLTVIYLSFDENPISWKNKAKQFPFMNKNNCYLLRSAFNGEFAKKYKINSIPRHLIFDKTGKLKNNNAVSLLEK